MASLITIDENGATAASLAEIVAEYERRFRERFGDDLSLSPQTPQSQIIGISAAITAEVLESIVEAANANSVDHAGGVLLTQLGSILDVERRTATRSRVTATLAGVAGTGVLAGSQARTDDGDVFETLADVVLSPTGVDVNMQAIETGPIAAPAGELTSIVTVIPGWESITNANAGSIGRDGQTDQDYRLIYQSRTGRLAAGVQSAMQASVVEAGATDSRIEENSTNASVTRQDFTIFGHSIIAVVQSGSDADVERAIETRRGQGIGTMTAIRGGAPDNSNLDSVNAGRISWDGVEFTGLDLSSAATGADKAAALTALLADAATPVVVSYIDGRYVAVYAWRATSQPVFANGTSGSVATNFGLLPANTTISPGPFIRTRERALTISASVSRRTGFPADGLERLRNGIAAAVQAYGIGDEVWSNDILTAMEAVPGTRVSSLTVQFDGTDASGVAVPLDSVWVLPSANLEITIT